MFGNAIDSVLSDVKVDSKCEEVIIDKLGH